MTVPQATEILGPHPNSGVDNAHVEVQQPVPPQVPPQQGQPQNLQHYNKENPPDSYNQPHIGDDLPATW